jgi:transcriptional regulator with XRE-family HTH domain
MNHPEKIIENIGRRVAELRLKLGLTQDALAEKAGVTGGYIRQIEGGWKNMRVTTLCRLADVLGCETADLFKPASMKKPSPGRPRQAKPTRGHSSLAIAAESPSAYRVKKQKRKK